MSSLTGMACARYTPNPTARAVAKGKDSAGRKRKQGSSKTPQGIHEGALGSSKGRKKEQFGVEAIPSRAIRAAHGSALGKAVPRGQWSTLVVC